MLVLSRKEKETVRLHLTDGSHFDVTLVKIRGKTVRLGFEGSKEVRVERITVDSSGVQTTVAHERGDTSDSCTN